MSRREAIGQLAAIGIGLTSASTVLAACRPNGNPKPNIVVIIADDMRYDHLQFMPNVQSLIQGPGRTFTQGRCNVPLCQPSRVGLMTGQMSKHNNELKIGFNGTRSPTTTTASGSGSEMPVIAAATSAST